MGKRVEKAFAKDKGAGAHDVVDDDPNKTPEPYVCTGQFHNDFHELCRRNNMVVIPDVVNRPHRPQSPTSTPLVEEKTNKANKKDDKKNQPPPEPEPEPETTENEMEPPPKTYLVKDKFEYFKPCVQVEMDPADKHDVITEVYVRGWRIDEPMMDVFKQCWPKLDRLNTINLWNTGLTDTTLSILANIMLDCPSVKNLVLDNNPVPGQRYNLFLKENSFIQHLSLRYSNITDKGAQLIGTALGTTRTQNTKLISLNLNGNAITDVGMAHICKGLRMNRTLLSLSLSNNKFGDPAAEKLAEVISRFPLTHEEVVQRRKLFSDKGSPERKSTPPGSRHADSRDRPVSVRSKDGVTTKPSRSARQKRDSKVGKEEEKHEKVKGKKETEKSQKKVSSVDVGKNQPKKAEKGKGKGKGIVTQEVEAGVEEVHEVVNPLLETVEHLDNGKVMMVGNRNLISLNLSHNKIGELGTKAIHQAAIFQTSISQFSSQMKPGNTGLMRICLNRNMVSRDSDTLKKLNALMATKDPFYKAPIATPDQETITQN